MNVVQCTTLGNHGRFGNQLFQYAFVRAYAEYVDAELQFPAWIGEEVFEDVQHVRPSVDLPRLQMDENPVGKTNVDLYGYFQDASFFKYYNTEKLRKWFRIKPEWIERFSSVQHSVVAHLRRGDYARRHYRTFCLVSEESYVRACLDFGLDRKKLVWVSEEKQKDHGLPEQLKFLPDFFTMINAQHLLRANSTFSFWAGFFSKGQVYSPVVENKTGKHHVSFVKGNKERIVKNGPLFEF